MSHTQSALVLFLAFLIDVLISPVTVAIAGGMATASEPLPPTLVAALYFALVICPGLLAAAAVALKVPDWFP